MTGSFLKPYGPDFDALLLGQGHQAVEEPLLARLLEDKHNAGLPAGHAGVVQALAHGLCPFVRKVELYGVLVREAVNTGAVLQDMLDLALAPAPDVIRLHELFGRAR